MYSISNDHSFQKVIIKYGVPQVLGPLLFLLYLNV